MACRQNQQKDQPNSSNTVELGKDRKISQGQFTEKLNQQEEFRPDLSEAGKPTFIFDMEKKRVLFLSFFFQMINHPKI